MARTIEQIDRDLGRAWQVIRRSNNDDEKLRFLYRTDVLDNELREAEKESKIRSPKR